MYTLDGVQNVQVVGIPDPDFGEIVGAFIIPAEGADLTEEDVRDFARSKIARYKVPKHVFFVDHYPLTASGKVQKYQLREWAKERLGIDQNVFAEEEKLQGPGVLIHADQCKACGLCIEFCPKKLLRQGETINALGYAATEYVGEGCTGCGTCYYVCPEPGGITVIPKPKKAGTN